MKERAVLFHRNFPEKKISVYQLRKLYQLHKIRRKVIRKVKMVRVDKMEE